MSAAHIPDDKGEFFAAKRAEVLRELGIFNNKSNAALDSITELVADICETPVTAVTLLNDERLILKAIRGAKGNDTALSDAFCLVAVENSALLCIPDATTDIRFRDNLFVTGEPFLRAYVGAPITVRGGVCVGTLCAFDIKPRNFTPDQVRLVTNLSKAVSSILEQEVSVSRIEELSRSLRDSEIIERRFETIFDGLQEGIVVRNSEGVILNANPSAARILGVNPDQLLGKKPDVLNLRLVREDGQPLPPDQLPANIAMRTGKAVNGMVVGVDAPGQTRRWLIVKSQPYYSTAAPGEVHTATSFADITVEKQRETDLINATTSLKKALAVAESANKAKTAFLANMSHEIRTPLNGIVGVASVLRRTNLDNSQQEMIDLIASSGQALGRLLNDTLDLAQIEAQQLELKPAPFLLASEVRAAAELFKISATEKSLGYTVEIGPSCQKRVIGDATRIRQIISNLVSNAIKFTEAGSIHIRMRYSRATSENTPGVFTVLVSDTGIGFDKSFSKIIFHRFQQADETITRRYGGTGLGLSISQRLASEMDGTIRARSTPGTGSVFRFKVPMPEEISAQDALIDTRDAITSDEQSLKILVAEDHPVNQKMMQIIFDAVGFEFDIATNGLEAVRLNEQTSYDCIILDIHMPEMDGVTALKHIRESNFTTNPPDIPIIMLTADTSEKRASHALAAGANCVLHKPITADAILRGIQEAIYDKKASAHGA